MGLWIKCSLFLTHCHHYKHRLINLDWNYELFMQLWRVAGYCSQEIRKQRRTSLCVIAWTPLLAATSSFHYQCILSYATILFYACLSGQWPTGSCFSHGVKHVGIVTSIFSETFLFKGCGMFQKTGAARCLTRMEKKLGLYLLLGSDLSQGSSSLMTTSPVLSFQHLYHTLSWTYAPNQQSPATKIREGNSILALFLLEAE